MEFSLAAFFSMGYVIGYPFGLYPGDTLAWTFSCHGSMMVTLDFSPSKTVAPVLAPIEDIWQKPILLKNLPLPKFKLKPKPTPPVPQTAQAGDQGPVRSLAEVSQMPHFKIQVKPIYPDSAKHSGIEGVVVLQVEINAFGEVTNIEVLQSLGYGCDEAATDAMRKSSFTPAYIGSNPVPVRTSYSLSV